MNGANRSIEVRNGVLTALYESWLTGETKVQWRSLAPLLRATEAEVDHAIDYLAQRRLIEWRTNTAVCLSWDGVEHVEEAGLVGVDTTERVTQARLAILRASYELLQEQGENWLDSRSVLERTGMGEQEFDRHLGWLTEHAGWLREENQLMLSLTAEGEDEAIRRWG